MGEVGAVSLAWTWAYLVLLPLGWVANLLVSRFGKWAYGGAVILAVLGGYLRTLVTRPAPEVWAHRHSFEVAFANHFWPPTLGILIGLCSGIVIARASRPSWVVWLCAPPIGMLTQLMVALFLLTMS